MTIRCYITPIFALTLLPALSERILAQEIRPDFSVGTPHYFLSDHLGSVRAIVDGNGDVEASYDYLPYGTLWSTSDSDYCNDYLFGGKEKQTILEANLYDSNARFLSTDGIFTSIDPQASRYPHINPYVYCASDPINLIDTDGEKIYYSERIERNPILMSFLESLQENKIYYSIMKSFYKDYADVFIDISDIDEPSNSFTFANTMYVSLSEKKGYPKIVINKRITDEDGNLLIDRTSLFVVLLHEGYHAKMFYIKYLTDNWKNLYPGYSDFELRFGEVKAPHEQMAAFDREDMITGMKEFDEHENRKHDDTWYESRSWHGLLKTISWYDFERSNPRKAKTYKYWLNKEIPRK